MRRLAAVVFLVCALFTLALAARHNHLESLRSGHSDACMFCSGALATGPSTPDVTPPSAGIAEPAAAPAHNPDRRFLLQLDHSGCAPPLA